MCSKKRGGGKDRIKSHPKKERREEAKERFVALGRVPIFFVFPFSSTISVAAASCHFSAIPNFFVRTQEKKGTATRHENLFSFVLLGEKERKGKEKLLLATFAVPPLPPVGKKTKKKPSCPKLLLFPYFPSSFPPPLPLRSTTQNNKSSGKEGEEEKEEEEFKAHP